MDTQELVSDINQDQFMADVIAASETTPIVVDFWAPWCGPCRSLIPNLEAAINKREDGVRLVKVNIDENQELAAQLEIRSVPTVYGVKGGKAITGFQGAIGPADIDKFIDDLVAQDVPADDAGTSDA